MQLSGAQILVQSLKAEGVEYVFGYPGGAVLEIYDALFQLNKFKHILVRHEQAAVHAADAYARTSGKVGVALVTSGPGRPVLAIWKAFFTVSANSLILVTKKLCFTQGRDTPTISISWKASEPIAGVPTCPEITTIGIESV